MELKINTPTFPEAISFNYEELKAEIEEKVKDYTGLVYTDDLIKEAKADVARLRKFVKVLSDERIKVKKECLKPYEDFEKKIAELSAIVNKPIEMIDAQIKEFDEQKKAKKKADIEDYYQECAEMGKVPSGVSLLMFFDEKWLNASVSMKQVEDAIDEKLRQIQSDLFTIDNLHEFAFEARTEYLRTLDLGRAISEGQRLADIQKRKEEFERTQAAKLAEMKAKEAEEEAKAKAEQPKVKTIEPPVYRIKFWADLTIGQAESLKQYFKLNHIPFGKIER